MLNIVCIVLQNSTSSSESDSDCYKEPANKYPRLSEKGGSSHQHYDYSSSEVGIVFLTIIYNENNNVGKY